MTSMWVGCLTDTADGFDSMVCFVDCCEEHLGMVMDVPSQLTATSTVATWMIAVMESNVMSNSFMSFDCGANCVCWFWGLWNEFLMRNG